MGNRHDAEDVTQEAFLRFYRHKKPFTDEEHKKAFLIRVAVNLCKDLQKSAWFRKRTGPVEEFSVSQSLSESNVDEAFLREQILKLKPNYRAVIFLFYYEGYTAAETAKILKISETAVTTRLNRARNQLRTQLFNERNEIYE